MSRVRDFRNAPSKRAARYPQPTRLAVDREERVSGHHGEELLVAVSLALLVVDIVMLLDHLVTGVAGRSC